MLSHINVGTGQDLTIADDGRGFDPAAVQARPTDKGGAGLANLKARVEALGGQLSLDSGTNGAKIMVTWPR